MAAVAQITTYQELQDHVASTLLRTDLSTEVTAFIQMAEQTFMRDPRVRKLQDAGTLSVSADGTVLPSDLYSVESWYHDDGTRFGPIEVVNADMLGQLKGSRFGNRTGAPEYAAIIDGVARYAPTPDQAYATKFVYWRKVDPLTAGNTTNWLLDDHADIYVYGALMEASPYLMDDNRVPIWEAQLEKRLEALHQATQDSQFSGTLRRRFRPIGG
jgi:hypothetical protein